MRFAMVGLLRVRIGSLRGKIVLLAVLTAFFSTLVIGTSLYQQTARVAFDKDVDKLVAETRLLTPRFRAVFDQIRGDILSISRMPPVEGMIQAAENGGIDLRDGSTFDQWRSRLGQIFISLIEFRPNYLQVRLISMQGDGREIVRVDRQDGFTKEISLHFLQDKGGEPYSDLARRLMPGDVSFSAVSYNIDHGKLDREMPVIRAVMPVYDPSGNPYAFFVVNAHFGAMFEDVVAAVSPDMSVYIVNDAGDYMVRNRGSSLTGVTLAGGGDGKRPLAIEAIRRTEGKQETLFMDLDGVPSVVHVARLQFDGTERGRYLKIALSRPRHELLAGAREIRDRTFFTGFLIIFGVSIFAGLIAGRLTRPLNEMVRSIRKYDSGETSLDLPTGRRDEVGELSASFVGLVRRLEETRKADQDSRRRFSAILDNTVDGLITIDDRGTIQSFNAGASSIFGYTAEETIGRNVNMLMPEHHARQHDGYLQVFRETGEQRIIGGIREVEGRRKDGTVFSMELSVSEIVLDQGTIFSGVIRDITERKSFEAAIELQSKELIRTNGKLQELHDAAETANRTKSEFLATMSHEIRTPLNGVIGMASVVLEARLPPEQHEQIEIVYKSAKALLTIINDILDFSKLEAGKLELEETAFDIGEIVDSVAELMYQQAADKKLVLTSCVAPLSTTRFIGDPGRLRQVLLNLVSNAIKFTADGGVTIRMLAEGLADDRVDMRMEVQDTGIGISPDVARGLFERFVQADASITRKFGGTGLGLAICRQIVELMGGEMGVDSVPDKGSTFWCRFSLRLAEDSNAHSLPTLQGRDMRVLIVGNRPVLNEGLRQQFELWGVNSDIVSDVSDVRESVVAKRYECLIIDQRLSGESGAIICRELRSDPETARIHQILLTHRETLEPARQSSGPDFARILSQPVQPGLLFDIVAELAGSDRRYPRNRPEVQWDSEGTPLRPLRILLAEDNQINQRVVEAMLLKEGHRIEVANNGTEALTMANRSSYDVILMDIQMPEMGGIEATAKIRALGGNMAKIPIIAMTANAMKGDKEEYLEAGMNDYLSKPVDKKRLLKMLFEKLSG